MTGLPPKLCKDCRHFKEDPPPSGEMWKRATYIIPIQVQCHRLGKWIDPVYGEELSRVLDCHRERMGWYDGDCGKSGRYWEPKE